MYLLFLGIPDAERPIALQSSIFAFSLICPLKYATYQLPIYKPHNVGPKTPTSVYPFLSQMADITTVNSLTTPGSNTHTLG